MRAGIWALLVGLSMNCSCGGSGGSGGSGGNAGGRGGQAGGTAGKAGGAAGQAGGAAGQASGAAGQAGGAAGQASGAAGQAGGAAGQMGGASGQGGTGGAGGGIEIDAGINGCARLAGLSFQSIDERECGNAPPDSGPALCHWRISFTNATTFTWSHSDYVESGTYTCGANTITAQTQTRGTLTAILNPSIWRFTWDGVVYVCTGCPP
jgi:hypothetical protein